MIATEKRSCSRRKVQRKMKSKNRFSFRRVFRVFQKNNQEAQIRENNKELKDKLEKIRLKNFERNQFLDVLKSRIDSMQLEATKSCPDAKQSTFDRTLFSVIRIKLELLENIAVSARESVDFTCA